MRATFFLLSFLFATNIAFSQVKGTVSDHTGEALPFASVYVQGTTNGTTTNLKGEYSLPLEEGSYQLVFQYIGYKQRVIAVVMDGKPQKLDVRLEPESIELATIEVKANTEDPAYPIMRKAIEKREYYKNQVESFSCDVYIKGNVKVLDAPKKLLGQDVGDLDGSLDTTRQGIVYLSESISKLYFKQPDEYKEVMVSSKVSGNNQGFSYNSAQEMNINFYHNFATYGRNIMSPIAEGAMAYYKYRLQGVVLDEEGHLINKIEVIPKRSEDPVYQGVIYIVDKLWNIQSADLYVTGNRAQMPLFDTLFIRQTHVPVAQPDTWRLFSQTFSLIGGAFGFKFGGSFTGIYSNYNLSPNLGDKFFGNELMKVEKAANEKDSSFWQEVRPVPLTQEEVVDYHKKDSIRVVRESKPFLDSLDKVNNKFKFNNLLFGYTHQNSWKRSSFSIKSPLNTIQFNAVQGFNLNLDLSYTKAFNKERNKQLEVNGKLNYGFSEEKFRASGGLTYNFNPKKFSRLEVRGGALASQFNELEPISPLLNTSYSLFGHRNYIRLYDKKFFQINYRHEIMNGWMLYPIAQFADRSPLENHSDYSFFYKDSRTYAPNDSLNSTLPDGAVATSKALVAGFSLRLRLGQKFYNYPNEKFLSGSKYPDFWIHYRKGISINPGSGNAFSSDVDYDRLSVAFAKNNIKLGLVGQTSFRAEAGKFLNNKALYFYDYRHFLGNEIQIANYERYLYSFKMLPYYEFSTRDAWAEVHWEHNFKGFITDKIPGVKKLGWNLVAGANFLYTTEKKDYFEASLGLSELGVGILRFLRVDVVSSFINGKYDSTGYLIGINLPLGNLELL